MKIFLLSSLIMFLTLLISSCKKDNPPVAPPVIPPAARITVTSENVSCTEVWLKLTLENFTLPVDVQLNKDGMSLVQVNNLSRNDTVIYVDSLLPGKIYNITAIVNNTEQTDSSDLLEIVTLDTTTNNFAWQTWIFGEHSSSILNDVAIIDENNIWAVGEIYLLDSTGVPNPDAYNAAHWDGSRWELKRIKTNACGGVVYPPIKAIFVFSSDNILFAHIDGSISHYNGTEFTNDCSLITQLNGSANKVWGVSRNDYYVVSSNGFIAHYKNRLWSRIESRTDVNINDIWGNTDNSGEQLILCAASNFGTNDQKKLLRINNNSVDTLSWTPQRTLYTLWFNSGDKIYAGGSGVFNNAGDIWKEEKSLPHNFTFRIRGNDYNDIYATGGFGYFAHFNGYSWQVLSSIALQGGDYESLSTSGNTTCVVGYEGAKAVVTIITK